MGSENEEGKKKAQPLKAHFRMASLGMKPPFSFRLLTLSLAAVASTGTTWHLPVTSATAGLP